MDRVIEVNRTSSSGTVGLPMTPAEIANCDGRAGSAGNCGDRTMPTPCRSGRAYKEITLLQLRSFCETVRLGSLTAAADSLGLARPTVWEQVHALEHHLGMQLVEPHARGCQSTEAGRFLAEMAGPLVTGISSLKQGSVQRHSA